MKIIVVGGTGVIGSAVVRALAPRHEVIAVGRTKGDLLVDLTSRESIRSMFEQTGRIDALVSAAGNAAWKPLTALSDEDFAFSLSHKLMGQINLVRVGLDYINDGGSFTLTSGVLAHEPMPGSTAVSLVNAGLEGFARAAALELPRSLRINVVSPPWVSETLEQMGQPGDAGLRADVVARAYVNSVEGDETGAVIDARQFAKVPE